MQQVICLHGGNVRKTKKHFLKYLEKRVYNPRDQEKDRKNNLQTTLGKKYKVCNPKMPCKENAKYKQRKIHFEKTIYHPTTDKNIILIGHSLGAIFLLKRLSENTCKKQIIQLHLVSPGWSSKKHPLYSFASQKKNIHTITKQIKDIHIYHSTDDQVCDYADSQKIHTLLHGSHLHTFHDRGHFKQTNFPELIKNINNHE